MQGEPNPLQVAKWEVPLYWHGEKVKQLSGDISAQPWSLLVQLRLSGWLLKLELQNCLLDNGNCHHISTNSPGSVSCYCKAGYNAVSVLKRISNAQKASGEEVCGKKNAYPEQRSRCRPGQYLARNRTVPTPVQWLARNRTVPTPVQWLARNRTVPEKAMAEGKTKKKTNWRDKGKRPFWNIWWRSFEKEGCYLLNLFLVALSFSLS